MNKHHLRLILIVFTVFAVSGPAFAQERFVAVTFDDLPIMGTADSLEQAQYVTRNLLAKTKHIPVTGFVNEKKLFFPGEIDQRVALLEAWLEMGHDLGNHTFSHFPINSTPFEDYAADLIRGETVTSLLLEKRGKSLRFFRHPQLRTGPTSEYRRRLEAFLKERRYRIAPVTIDNNEYLFSRKYSQADADPSQRLKIAAAYVEYIEDVSAHFERLSKDFLGYEVKQMLLLHANELNADHFDKLVSMYKDRGYRFISLDEALEDPAYRLPEVTSKRGLSWIHRWMLAKGLDVNEEPREPIWIRN